MAAPPIFTHAVNLYRSFYEAPNAVSATETDAANLSVQPGDRLFIGHWSTQFQNDPDLPGESTQQKAYAFLQDRDCVEVLRRGGRDYPSVILLKRPPDAEDIGAASSDSRAVRLGKVGTIEVGLRGVLQRLTAIEDRVTAAEGRHDALVRDAELTINQVREEIMARIDGLVEPTA